MRWEPRLCLKPLPSRLTAPVIACFPDPESRNINRLLLISFHLARGHFAGEARATRDLEHHLWYLSEVRVGDMVAIRLRMLARSPKLCHYMMFMVNETRGTLSSLFECVHAHADLKARRTAAFPAQAVAAIDALIAAQQALAWPAPISGSMAVKAASSA